MKTILLVEDVPLNRDLMVQILEEHFHILQAEDGHQGLSLAAQKRPDLVLIDLSLPGIDGWMAVKKLKSNPATRKIPVVALTAHAMTGDREKAMGLGFDAYLTKPIDERLLFRTIRKLLEHPNP